MFDFVSELWSWFIIIPTVAGFIGLVWLILWQSEPERPDNEEAQSMGHVWDGDLQELNNPMPKWWLNLFYATLVFSAIYLVLYPGLGSFKGVFGWTQEGSYNKEVAQANEIYGPIFTQHMQTPVEELANNTTAMKSGQRLYSTYCALCHGPSATGANGFPDLTDDDWLYGGDGKAIEASILQGRTGAMPPWQAALGKKGVFQVSEYVLSLSGREVNQTEAALGKTKYQAMCVACHGTAGKGNQALGAPDLTDNIWLYGGSQKAVIDSIANGRQGNMPAHGDFLGEAKVHLLAAYVYSLSNKKADK